MNKLNWNVRFQSKYFWLGALPLAIAFITSVASVFGFEIDLSVIGAKLSAVIVALFALLSFLGVVVDPTTKGIGDSEQAQQYTEPK